MLKFAKAFAGDGTDRPLTPAIKKRIPERSAVTIAKALLAVAFAGVVLVSVMKGAENFPNLIGPTPADAVSGR